MTELADRIMDVVRARPGVSAKEIVEAVPADTATQVYTTLHSLWNNLKLRREGDRGSYTYFENKNGARLVSPMDRTEVAIQKPDIPSFTSRKPDVASRKPDVDEAPVKPGRIELAPPAPVEIVPPSADLVNLVHKTGIALYEVIKYSHMAPHVTAAAEAHKAALDLVVNVHNELLKEDK